MAHEQRTEVAKQHSVSKPLTVVWCLDMKRMLTEIYEIVRDERLEDMSWNASQHRPFKQEESEMMATMLSRIYMIAHCLTCSPCQTKYTVTDLAALNSKPPQTHTKSAQDPTNTHTSKGGLG